MYQVPLLGLQTTRSAFPSPSKSPLRGTSPGAPQDWTGAPPVLLVEELSVNQRLPVAWGLQTVMSLFPSPSKSPSLTPVPPRTLIGRAGVVQPNQRTNSWTMAHWKV